MDKREVITQLAIPLQAAIEGTYGTAFYPPPRDATRTIAASILATPQAHIDALVEAGVLERLGGRHNGHASPEREVYRVVQPHTHTWYVKDITSSGVSVRVVCNCGARDAQPNRLPIECPSD